MSGEIMSVIGQILAAVAGTVSFALLFGVPTGSHFWCGFIGGAGWAVYLAASCFWTAPACALTASIAVVFLSRLAAVAKECPVTIFLISGIFPLVPGAGVYWTAYYIVMDELGQAVQTGYLAVKVAVAIVLGIIFVFEIPQGLFRALAGKHKL